MSTSPDISSAVVGNGGPPLEKRDTDLKSVSTRILVFVALAAVVVKAAVLFLVFPALIARHPVGAEIFPDGYDLIASNLASGNGYRTYADTSLTMLRTPGYVVVLAGLFSIFGNSLLPVQVMNFVFSILTALLVFGIARRVVRSDLVGIIAAAIVFLHPGTIVADSRGGPESMLMLFIALSLWLCEIAVRNLRLRDFAWLGLAFGGMMLIKSSVALIFPGVAVVAIQKYWRSDRLRAVVSGFTLAGVVAGFCMTPWIARNLSVSGKFVPTMTVGGLAAFQGQYVVKNLFSGKDHGVLVEEASRKQGEIAKEMNLPMKGFCFPQFYSVADEVLYYSELGRRARKDYAESPSLVARAVAYNAVAFWVQGRTARATAANAVIAVPLLLMVAFGARSAWKQGRDISVLIVFSLCFILPHLLIMSMARYYIPLLPALSVLAAVPLASALSRVVALMGGRLSRSHEGNSAL